MENYTTNKEILTKLNQYYTSLGYRKLSKSSIMYAIRKAEKVIAPKIQLDKKYNRKYYEASFLDEAFDYILKNHTFDLKRDREFDQRQNQIKYTKLLLPCFDLLIGSSKTLGITEKSFGKTAWFSMMNLYNLSRSMDVEEFRKEQMKMTLEKEIVVDSTGFISMDLEFAESQLTAMSELLLDFERLIIKEKNKDDDILFNIKDFNEITKRLYETYYFRHGEDMLPYFDGDTINAFLEASENSHIMSKKEDFLIKYEAGNKDFWKKYS